MRSVSIIALVLGAMLIAAPAGAQTNPMVAPAGQQSTASIVAADSAGTLRLTSVSHRYRLVSGYRDSDPIVIHETVNQHCCVEAERSVVSTFAVDAWPARRVGTGAPLWHATVDADDAVFVDPFYRTVLYGCCDASSEYTYFNLRSGGPLFVASGTGPGPLKSVRLLATPVGTPLRVIAFQDTWTAHRPPEVERDSATVGVLQYGPIRGPMARIVVLDAPAVHTSYRVVNLEFVIAGRPATDDATLPSANEGDVASLSGFAVRIHLQVADDEGPDAIITIPVVRDVLAIGQATGPRTLRLARSELTLAR